MLVNLYTDGSCKGNPGPGGYGAVLLCKGEKEEVQGSLSNVTNNQMELLAVIKRLEKLNAKTNLTVKVYSDSQYIVDAFNKDWIENWRDNNWKRAGGKLSNRYLWMWLYSLTQQFLGIEFNKVKAHNGNTWNELADDLAQEAAEKLK